jgi:hypothetical protein
MTPENSPRTGNPIHNMILETLENPDGVYMIEIHHRMISRSDTSPVVSITDFIFSRGIQESAAARLAFEITGYEKDMRDPTTIGEVRGFFKELDRQLPLLPFFLENEESESLVKYAASLCTTWITGDRFTIDEEELRSFLNRVSRQIVEACERWNIDPEPHIDRLWSSFELEYEQDAFDA